eukprot:328076-Rhodomonas_salina.1
MSFKTVGSALRPKVAVRHSYSSVLAKLKAWCEQLGWNPALFATHSMHRGRVTDLLNAGVMESIIQKNGRWRSAEAFEGYLDDEVVLAQRVAAFKEARA